MLPVATVLALGLLCHDLQNGFQDQKCCEASEGTSVNDTRVVLGEPYVNRLQPFIAGPEPPTQWRKDWPVCHPYFPDDKSYCMLDAASWHINKRPATEAERRSRDLKGDVWVMDTGHEMCAGDEVWTSRGLSPDSIPTDLSDKIYAIVGVSGGFGFGLALELAERGAKVFGCARSQGQWDKVRESAKQTVRAHMQPWSTYNGRINIAESTLALIDFTVCDVRSAASMLTFAAHVNATAQGALSGYINTAGGAQFSNPDFSYYHPPSLEDDIREAPDRFTRSDPRRYPSDYNVFVMGTLHTSTALDPILAADGRILMVSSIIAFGSQAVPDAFGDDFNPPQSYQDGKRWQWRFTQNQAAPGAVTKHLTFPTGHSTDWIVDYITDVFREPSTGTSFMTVPPGGPGSETMQYGIGNLISMFYPPEFAAQYPTLSNISHPLDLIALQELWTFVHHQFAPLFGDASHVRPHCIMNKLHLYQMTAPLEQNTAFLEVPAFASLGQPNHLRFANQQWANENPVEADAAVRRWVAAWGGFGDAAMPGVAPDPANPYLFDLKVV